VRLDLACPAVAATFRARVSQLDTDRHEQYAEVLAGLGCKLAPSTVWQIL
jgi:hypothetical protein